MVPLPNSLIVGYVKVWSWLCSYLPAASPGTLVGMGTQTPEHTDGPHKELSIQIASVLSDRLGQGPTLARTNKAFDRQGHALVHCTTKDHPLQYRTKLDAGTYILSLSLKF